MVSLVRLSAMFILSSVISLSMSNSLDQTKVLTIRDSELSDSVWINQDNQQCPLLFRYDNATRKCECSIEEIINKESVKCSKEGADTMTV